MSRLHLCLLAGAAMLGLAGCSSAPVHYYTLIPPAGSAEQLLPHAGMNFELMPVNVPAQVDVPQLVVRTGGQGMQPLDGQRWIAPLADEIHGALAAGLASALGGRDMGGLPINGTSRVRIMVNMRRFESMPGDHVLIEAAWSLRFLGTNYKRTTMSCVSVVREPAGAGYDALVAAHQKALAALAHGIAESARSFNGGDSTFCPLF